MQKTNAMRMLETAGIRYETREYAYDESDLSGTHAAEEVGLPYEQVYKTLVTRGAKELIVFCIPVDAELNLKAAARAAGEKSVSMLHVKELLPNTGYVRGGCSPIGMKKPLRTYVQEDAQLFDVIAVSGGARGLQILIEPDTLINFINAEYADVT